MTRQIAIVGSGYMGGGIAQVLALAGNSVRISDVTAEVASANYDRLVAEATDFVAAGIFPVGAVESIRTNLTPASSIEEAVADADFIEEAVPELLDLKHATLARISAANPDAVIGSNTSTIRIAKLAEAVENPGRFLGVHFSNPAPFIPGVELIPHSGTDLQAVATVETVLTAAGKQTARVTDATGFVLNRLQYALFTEANQMVEEGVATVEDIDTVIRSTLGFRMPFFGPFAIADMAGLDVYDFCYRSMQADFPERFATPKRLAELVAAGKLGTKTGAGYYSIPVENTPALVAYRNTAYSRMQQLLDELGPAPLD